ncbi:anthrax toxin-like adenylyl cyclase domain-containing protein, partial [Bacillus cereus]
KIDELPKETKEKIERIDKSLEAAPTLTEDLTFFLNIESVKDESDPTKPNLDVPYDEPFYLIGDMKKTDLENEEDMRVELTVPKEAEESVAYIENDGQEQIVFKRGKSYVLDKESAKKSTENGKDVLVIKAQLSIDERERKIETTIDKDWKYKEGDAKGGAVDLSGLVPSHVEKFKDVAKEKQTYILFRPVNKLSTSLIAHGAATKGMNVHGKSSDWGPMAGYIPFDADLSKKSGNQNDVEKGNDDNKHSIADNKGIIEKTQLKISTERIQELKSEGIFKNINSENGYDTFVLSKDTVYEFRREQATGKVEYKTKDGAKLEDWRTVIKEWKPVEVMAKIIDSEKNPLTADYDMFGLAPTLAMIKERIVKEDKEAWETAMNQAQPLDTFKGITELLIKYGLNREADPEKGKLTQWQREMIDALNKAATDAGYTGGTVVNHGTEQDNTEFPEQDKEIFIVTPDGKEILIQDWDDLQKFIQKNITEQGLLYYFNRSYNKIAGGNKKNITWKDPITNAIPYTIPSEKELFQEINDIKQANQGIFLPKSFYEKTSTLSKLSETLSNYYNPANRYLETERKLETSTFWAMEAIAQINQILEEGRKETPTSKEDFRKYESYFEQLKIRIMNQTGISSIEQRIDQLLKQINFKDNNENQAFKNFEDAIQN